MLNGKEVEISQHNVKPLVYDLFKEFHTNLDNPSIFDKLKERGYIKDITDKNYRKKWVGAISLCLGNLKQYGKIEELKEEKAGRSKVYRMKLF